MQVNLLRFLISWLMGSDVFPLQPSPAGMSGKGADVVRVGPGRGLCVVGCGLGLVVVAGPALQLTIDAQLQIWALASKSRPAGQANFLAVPW